MEPLAFQIRPKSLEGFIGQKHVLNPEKPLYLAIKKDRLFSFILIGPPGSGKTTLFDIIQQSTSKHTIKNHAQRLSANDIKNIEKSLRENHSQAIVLLVDEVHRLNRLEQDRLLSLIEDGRIIFIGATTENPSFFINKALLSRLAVFQLDRLSLENIESILFRAKDYLIKQHAIETWNISKDIIKTIAKSSNGDARIALNKFERMFLYIKDNESKLKSKDNSKLLTLIGENLVTYDKNKNDHYDCISAYIKSLRGSDADAGLYWLVRMLEGGEDPLYIIRRMLILAAEDIGNADPKALILTSSLKEAVELIGLPEAAIPMAEVTIYLALAPKSNSSYVALNKAKKTIRILGSLSVPDFLKNPSSSLDKKLGIGKGYIYPHDEPDGIGNTSFLPKELRSLEFYNPTDLGFEKHLKDRLKQIKTLKSKKERP